MGACTGVVQRIYTTDNSDPILILVAVVRGEVPLNGETVVVQTVDE